LARKLSLAEKLKPSIMRHELAETKQRKNIKTEHMMGLSFAFLQKDERQYVWSDLVQVRKS
jgi:hypothetical protein